MTAPAPARSQRLLVCNCQRTMEIDGKRLAEALGRPEASPCIPSFAVARSRPSRRGWRPARPCTWRARRRRRCFARWRPRRARPTSPSPTSANAPAGVPTSPPPCRRWRRCWPRRRIRPGPPGSPRSHRRACVSSTAAARRPSMSPPSCPSASASLCCSAIRRRPCRPASPPCRSTRAASARPPGISAASRSRSTATRRCCLPPGARCSS